MLRVCGIAFDHTINYGSCLQSYALKQTIENIQIDGEPCVYELIPYALIRKANKGDASQKANLIVKAKRFILRAFYRYKRHQFFDFEKRYIPFAEINTLAELDKLNDTMDTFVCGSDVIWSPVYNRLDGAYFLDFAKKYRFAYAVSIGNQVVNAEADQMYRAYVPNLDAISLREPSSKEIISRYTDKPLYDAIDPTLMLSPEEWEAVMDSHQRKKPYIFVYNTHIKPIFSQFLEKLKKETGLPVVHVTWELKDAIRSRSLHCPKPQEWLRLLYNAEYVVTNSFHGTAFSVLFHRKFFTVVDGDRFVRSNMRLYDFLESLGLEDRLVTEIGEIESAAPDFFIADQVLQTKRQASLEFLTQNLKLAAIESKSAEKNKS